MKKNRQIDKKTTMQVLIDAELHYMLKRLAVTQKTTIKALVEACIADLWEVKNADQG